MLWLDKNKRIWRTAILIMLLVALIGPWTFERINVPAKYPCSPPFIRLEGDFCGEPMSGIWILSFMIFGMVSSSMGLASGGIVFIDWARQFLFSSFLFLLILPFFTTILLIGGKDSRRLRIIHLIAWGMAIGIGLLIAFSSFSGPRWELLWGIWLFIGLAVSILVLELLNLTRSIKNNNKVV